MEIKWELVLMILGPFIGGGFTWLLFFGDRKKQFKNGVMKDEFDQMEEMVDSFSKRMLDLSNKLGDVMKKNMEVQAKLAELYEENNILKEKIEGLIRENEELKQRIKLHNNGSNN